MLSFFYYKKQNLKSMKHLITLIILLQTSINVNSQSNPFPYLKQITNKNDSIVNLFISSENTEIINKKIKDLDKDHPLYTNEDCISEMTLLAFSSINNELEKKYAIIYGKCPEPEFHFYDSKDLSICYGSISSLNLYITGNGHLYSSGHINSKFNIKRKLKFEENNIQEGKQPYYYVGSKTKTLKPITIYKTKDTTTPIANLPKNYKIEVLIAETSLEHIDYYLIKTEFGLVGWTKINNKKQKSIDVEGIFWNGL